MLVKSLAPVVAFVAATHAIETHGGIDFEVFWDADGPAETEPIRTYYQEESAKIASERLAARIKSSGLGADCLEDSANTGSDLDSLYNLKDCLAAKDENIFFDLFAEDIEEADEFWEKVIAESTKPRKDWIAAKAYVKCYYDGAMTAEEFAGWSSSPAADEAYLRGNAEHYYKTTDETGLLTQASHIFEGWGGVLSPTMGTKLTNFTVPEFKPRVFGLDPDYPIEWSISPLFGVLQRAGPKVLRSGTTWGVLHIGARNFLALEGSTGKSGIEIYGAVWYPPWDQSSEENQKEFKEKFLMDEDYQVVAEIVNFSLQALEDCKNGGCGLLSSDEDA
ncbi:hypothetical protein CC79DRAFT_1322673 [Sarocladium strictum]